MMVPGKKPKAGQEHATKKLFKPGHEEYTTDEFSNRALSSSSASVSDMTDIDSASETLSQDNSDTAVDDGSERTLSSSTEASSLRSTSTATYNFSSSENEEEIHAPTSLEDFLNLCNSNAIKNFNSLDAMLHITNYVIQNYGRADDQHVMMPVFNELLRNKPFIAKNILEYQAKNSSKSILTGDTKKIENTAQILYLLFRRMPEEIKEDSTFFYQITMQLQPPALAQKFNQLILSELSLSSDKRYTKNTDNLLSNYFAYLSRYPSKISIKALEKLVKKLSTDEGYRTFGTTYNTLLENADIAKKFVLTPTLLYELSVRYRGRAEANRENRIILAFSKAYPEGNPPSEESIVQLARNLFNKLPLSQIKTILDTLQDTKYQGTPNLSYFAKTLNSLIARKKDIMSPIDFLDQLKSNLEGDQQEQKIQKFIQESIQLLTPEDIADRSKFLASILTDVSVSSTVKASIITHLHNKLATDETITSQGKQPLVSRSSFASIFLNTAVASIEKKAATIDSQILRLLLPDKWQQFQISWDENQHAQTVARFTGKALGQQNVVFNSTMDWLNKQPSAFILISFKEFVSATRTDKTKLSSFISQMKIDNFTRQETLDLLNLMFEQLKQDDIVIHTKEWATLKTTLISKIQDFSATEIKLLLPNISFYQNSFAQWSQLGQDIISYLQSEPSKEHLLDLLQTDKQKIVIQYWLKSEASLEQIQRWQSRLDYSSCLAFALSSSLPVNNKNVLQQRLLSDPEFYASKDISNDAFLKLYSYGAGVEIVTKLLSDNTLTEEQKEAIYLRIVIMTATAKTDREDQAQACLACLTSERNNLPFAWSILQKDGATIAPLKESCSKATTSSKSVIFYHFSQAILAHADKSLMAGSYARELTASLDFWLFYANTGATFKPEFTRLSGLLTKLTLAEQQALLGEATARITELQALQPEHIRDILLTYSDSVKKHPDLLATFSQLLSQLYLKGKSISEVSAFLNILEQVELDSTTIQSVLSTLIQNRDLSSDFLKDPSSLANITDEHLNYWLAALSDEEQFSLYDAVVDNEKFRNFINLQQLQRLAPKISSETLPDCIKWTYFLEDKKQAPEFFITLAQQLNQDTATSGGVFLSQFIQAINDPKYVIKTNRTNYVHAIISAMPNISGETIGQWYQEAIKHDSTEQEKGIIQWLLESTHDNDVIVGVFRVLNDEQRIKLLEHPGLLERLSTHSVSNILALIQDADQREIFCFGTLMADSFANPDIQKHGFSLVQYISPKRCAEGFDSTANAFNDQKTTAHDLARIQRFGIMLLSSEEGAVLLRENSNTAKEHEITFTRLEQFQQLMVKDSANKLDNPFWFTADMIRNIPNQTLQGVFQELLSLDEQHLNPNNFTITHIFKALTDKEGSYADQNNQTSKIGTVFLLTSMIEFLTNQLNKKTSDGLPLLNIQEMSQAQTALDRTWEHIAVYLQDQDFDIKVLPSEETQIALLTLLSDKIASFLTFNETNLKAAIEFDEKISKLINEQEAEQEKELSDAERKKLIDDAPEILGIRQNVQRIQKVEWPLFLKISDVYGNLFTATFAQEPLPDLNTKEGEAYWQFCINNLLKLELILENPKTKQYQSLIENSIQALFLMVLDANSPERWTEFQSFFEAIRGKNTADGFGLIGLVDGMNNAEIAQFVDTIPLDKLDWLIHQVADETELEAEAFSPLIERYIQKALDGRLVIKDDDTLFERKVIATQPDIRFAIYEIIANNQEIIAKKPERLSANLRAFFIRHCYPDGALNPKKKKSATIGVLATLLHLPKFLYSTEQQKHIKELAKASQKSTVQRAITQPMEAWANKVEQALFSLTSDDREAVLPLFQALLSYYADELLTLKSELKDSSNIILDKFVEIADKIAVFFGTTIDKLLEFCDEDTKLAFVDEAFSGLKARRLVKTQGECNNLTGISNYRSNCFVGSLANIPENSRSLSYADGDLWHVFYIQETKEWGIIGRCPNHVPSRQPPVIEFLARFSDNSDSSPMVHYWDQETETYISYLPQQEWREILDPDTIQCIDNIATEIQSASFKETSPEQKPDSICNTILQAPSLSESRRQRSERGIQQWMNAAARLTEENTFRQEILGKIIQRNALAEIDPGLRKAAIAQITRKPVESLSKQDLDNYEKLDSLYRLREEYVVLTNWITNPVNIAQLYKSDSGLTLSDCIQALRERLPVLVKVGKDTAEKNREEYEQQLRELNSKKDADFGTPSTIIRLNKDDIVINNFYIKLTENIPEKVIEELVACDSLEDVTAILNQHNITAEAQELPPKSLLVREAAETGYTVEIFQEGSSHGQVFLSQKDADALLTTPSAKLDRAIQQRHLRAKIDREIWNARRAKQFSADDYLMIVINRLRENVQALPTSHNRLAEEANYVISQYLNSEYHDQRTAKTVTAWFMRGLEDTVRTMIGGDVAQCESVLSQFLSKHRFNVAKIYERQQTTLPAQTVYIYQNGKLIPVASITSNTSRIKGNTRNYTLTWEKEHEATEQLCQYYQAMRECDFLEAERDEIQRLIIQRKTFKSGLYHVSYGYLPKALEEIEAKIAQKQSIAEPTQDTTEKALQPGQTLYDKNGRCIGILNTDLGLEQDLLYGEDAWCQILVSQSLEELMAAESSINIGILDVINRGFLPDLLLETARDQNKHNFLRSRIQEIILKVHPFLSHKDSKSLMPHFSTEALLQFVDVYFNRTDKQSKQTCQALVSSLLTSPQHLSYFLSTEQRQLTLWKYLTKSNFSMEGMLNLLQTLTSDGVTHANPHTEQLSQLVRAAYFSLSSSGHPTPPQIHHFRMDQLPVSIIQSLPQQVRLDIFRTPENFLCLQKKHYFQALSHDLPPAELKHLFADFLRMGFKHEHNSGEGIIAFYRNLDEKIFWTVFNEAIPINSAQRQEWIKQGLFGNPAFMQAVAENLGENSVAKLVYRDTTKMARGIGEQLGLLDTLSDRYAAFTLDEIMQLVRHYKDHPSEESQTFLADWLFIQLQSEQLTLASNAEEDRSYIDALVWDEEGGIELLNLDSDAQTPPPTTKPLKAGISGISEEHLTALHELIGNPAFHGMMTAKYPLARSNLEALINEKAKRSAADFESFYDIVDENGTRKFSLQAAETPINLSIEGAYQNRAWVSITAITYALSESARQAQLSKNTTSEEQQAQQRRHWKDCLSDYVGSIRYVFDKQQALATSSQDPKALYTQLSNVRKTVLRFFYNRDFMKDAADDTLGVVLRRENFLLLMEIYNRFKESKDDTQQRICDEIDAIICAAYLSNPTAFLSTLSAFDRKTEWHFATAVLKLNKMLEGKTDEKLEKELSQARVNRRTAIAEVVVTTTAAGAAVGAAVKAAPLKGAMAGLLAGVIAGVAIEAEGRIEAGARRVFHSAKDAITAAYNGISSPDQNNARMIYRHREFEEKEQCKKRTGKIWGKSGFMASWRRLKEYRKDVSWFSRPFYTIGVYFGLVNEPRSPFHVESYREKMPTVYIGTEDQHSIQGNAILLSKGERDQYYCRFYDEKGECINPDHVTTVSLSQTTYPFLSKSKLSGQSVAKGTERSLFGQMLEKIESARNEAILKKESDSKQGYYDTSRTLVQPEQMSKATHQAIQQDTKNFSELRKRLLIIPQGFEGANNTQDQTNARMNESSLRAAISLVNLIYRDEKAQTSLQQTYTISNGCISRLWNGLTGWFTGNQLIARQNIQKLKEVLNTLLLDDPAHGASETTVKSYSSFPQHIALILAGNKGKIPIPSKKSKTEHASTLLDNLISNMAAQRIITEHLVARLKKNIAERKDVSQLLADLERSLCGGIKLATRVHHLHQDKLHREVEEVIKQCQQVQNLIIAQSTEPAVAKKLQNMIANITYECSHTAERLLLRRLEHSLSVLEKSPQSPIRDQELKSIKKEQWSTCKTILEVYPEDREVRQKFESLSEELHLSKDLACEKDLSILAPEGSKWGTPAAPQVSKPKQPDIQPVTQSAKIEVPEEAHYSREGMG